MEKDQFYQELISMIIKGKLRALGNIAIKKANETGCVQCDESGNVLSINCDPVEAADKVLAAYKTITGDIAISSARVHTLKLRMANREHPLPESLQN